MMNKSDLEVFLAAEFPQVSGKFVIEELGTDFLSLKMDPTEADLRPGGTISGPSMFAQVDVAAYLLILSRIGPKALAVTTNCAIDFMRKPAASTSLTCRARLLKLGRQLAVVDTLTYSDNDSAPVARANVTYSIPPR